MAFCLLPGLLFFILNQALAFSTLHGKLVLPLFLLGLGTFFLVSILAAAISNIFSWLRKENFLFKLVCIMGIIYLAIFGGLELIRWRLHYKNASLPVSIILTAISMALFAFSLKWFDGNFRGFRRWFLYIAFLAVTMAWAYYTPDIGFAYQPLQFFLESVLLVGLMLVIYQLRAGLPISARRGFLAIALIFACLIGLHLAGEHLPAHKAHIPARTSAILQAGFQDRPNIILIVWDAARRDHLSIYGYHLPTSPYLKENSAQTMIYNNALSVASWSLPSHASMFTGLYPRSHGAYKVPGQKTAQPGYDTVRWQLNTLPEILHKQGYACAGLSANSAWAGRRTRLNQGFDYFYDGPNSRSYITLHFPLLNYLVNSLQPLMPSRFYFPCLVTFLTAGEINDRALKWIDSLKPGRPFFIFANCMEPHGPWYPPPHIAKLFPGLRPELAFKKMEIRDQLMLKNQPLSQVQSRHLVAEHDAGIFYLDEQLEALENGLRQRGLYERTMVIVTADHGEYLGEHNFIGHRVGLYSEVLNIPLVIKYPYSKPAGVNNSIIEDRAIFNLILQSAGLKIPGPTYPWAAAAESYPTPFNTDDPSIQIRPLNLTQRAIYFENFKYLASSDGAEELYDLQADPAETANLITRNREKAEQGRTLLKEFLAQVPEAPANMGQQPIPLTPDQARTLRTLGYAH